jgi:hypothetical protein
LNTVRAQNDPITLDKVHPQRINDHHWLTPQCPGEHVSVRAKGCCLWRKNSVFDKLTDHRMITRQLVDLSITNQVSPRITHMANPQRTVTD